MTYMQTSVLFPGFAVQQQHHPHQVATLCPLLRECPCSDATAGPPPTSDALQVAYEAGLWQLLELFFLSNDLPDGYFTEVHLRRHRQLGQQAPTADLNTVNRYPFAAVCFAALAARAATGGPAS